jgi:uncharacterized membrane protein
LWSKEKASIIVFAGKLDYTSNLNIPDEGFVVRIRNKLGWGEGIWGRVLSGILALAILSSLGTLAYSIASPVKKAFTEFYLLDLSGEAKDYPSLLTVGEEGKVMVSIINREQEIVSYRVEVRIDGVINNQVGPIRLGHGEEWKEIMGFIPERAGDKQKVEFLLYRQGQNEVYRTLELPVDVR